MRYLLVGLAFFCTALTTLAQVEFQLKNDAGPMTIWFYEPTAKTWEKPILLDKQATAAVKLPESTNYVVVIRPENEKLTVLGEYSLAKEIKQQPVQQIVIKSTSMIVSHIAGKKREVVVTRLVPESEVKEITEYLPVTEYVTRVDPATQKQIVEPVVKYVPQTRAIVVTRMREEKTMEIEVDDKTYDETVTTRSLWLQPVKGTSRELKFIGLPLPQGTPPEPEFK